MQRFSWKYIKFQKCIAISKACTQSALKAMQFSRMSANETKAANYTFFHRSEKTEYFCSINFLFH